MHANVKYPRLHDREWLEEKYVQQKLAEKEIAELVGCTKSNVARMRKKYEIALNEDRKTRPNVIESGLSETDIQFLEGELLGDGSLIVPSDSSTARFGYTSKHKQYIEWLAMKLKDMGFELRVYHNSRNDNQSTLSTLAYEELSVLHERWYSPDKDVPKEFVLSPLSLRQWFIGDGSNSNKLMIHSHDFSEESDRRLKKMFKDIGISVNIHSTGFYICKDSTDRFFEYMLEIAEQIDDVYGYKWGDYY